jgi:diguanylate cyclase (GGDEF)-like protein
LILLVVALSLLFLGCILIIVGRTGTIAVPWIQSTIWAMPPTWVLAAIALATLGLVLISLLLIFSILAPLERLAKTAVRILHGEENVIVSVESDYAEVHTLSVALDEMAEQLDVLRNEMDALVRERTLQLNLTHAQLQNALAKQRESQIEQQRLMSRLHDLANTDALTGVFNRRAFNEILETQCFIAAQSKRLLAVLMLDIDDFKKINDTYGHQAGDDVLREVAGRCLSTLRSDDVVGRYGGEEFAFVLKDVSALDASEVAERVRMAICSTPIYTIAGPIPVSVSIGVAALSADEAISEFKGDNWTATMQIQGEDVVALLPQSLIQLADLAQYRAKKRGKNRVEIAVT